MLSITNYVMIILGLAVLILWIYMFFQGKQYADLFEGLDEQEYPFKEIYHVGYAVMQKIDYQYKSKQDRKLRKEIDVLYGDKYADYYLRVIYSQKVTFAFTLVVLSFCLYCLADDMLIFFVMIMLAGVLFYYFGTVTGKKIMARSEEMMSDFSNVVSKLALLTNAGMIMREAWEDVASTGDSALYLEMQKAVDEMNNGVSEVDALFNFGSRCMVPEIKKFSSTIVQGIIKGNNELTFMLQEQSKEVWALKKQNVKRQGEKAASKLLIPILMMFVGILIMILIPIFTNLGA